MDRLSKKYLIRMFLSALVVSAVIFISCSPASKSSSAKSPRTVILERRNGTLNEVSRDTVIMTGSDALPGSGLPQKTDAPSGQTSAIPGISAADISRLPELLSGVSADQAMTLLAGAVPDSLQPLLHAVLSSSPDELPAIMDTLPDDIKTLVARQLSAQAANVPGAAIPPSYRELLPDSLKGMSDDSLRRYAAAQGLAFPPDSLDVPIVVAETGDLVIMETPQRKKAFLEHPVYGKNRDSLIYDVKNRLIFVYGEGDLTYEDNNLKADYMIINVDTKEIYGTGVPDTLGVLSRPEAVLSGSQYTMDTILYDLGSNKAKIWGIWTQDGEGFLHGREVKKMPDNTINLAHGVYTTCDLDHPHFYIAMTKARVIPGKKIITGPAYFVMEDVPLYFLGIPGGFFPISSGPQAGFIMPTYGEETTRGFFLRDGGYYFTFKDYADLALTGGIYTLGSWELAARSNYILRYRFSGNFSANYARTIYGERNSTDYQNQGNFRIAWTHRQDPKARPNSTFSASVNFSTSGYNKNAATQLNDFLNTQTNSSISYARNWMAGTTPINLTTSFSHSQNSRDSTIAITLPSLSFSVGSFSPFKRKQAVGKERWYEKISMSYAMSMNNSFSGKERDMFTDEMWENLMNGVSHRIPIKTSFTLFNYLNFTPSFNYNEVWNFKRERREWDPVEKRVVTLDPEFGFFRMYSYNFSGSFSTKLYGELRIKRRPGKTGWLNGVRHVMTPSVGVSLAPDFTSARFGFREYYQSDSTGRVTAYNPLIGNPTMSASGPSASLTFSLGNQVEMKVASRSDSTGLKKITLIEQLSASGSYNFLADSMNLSNINLTLRTGNIFKNFGIQISAVWDPYVVVRSSTGAPVRTARYNIGNGKFGRIVSTSWSFGYTFNSSQSGRAAVNDINSGAFVGAYANPFDMSVNMDPALRRQYMVASYYDFSIPWNLGFNYSVGYSNNGLQTTISQTLGFNGSVTLTPKMGVTFNGGFDFARRSFTPGSFILSRDLHCWSMSFQWIPIGTLKSWSFHIGVNSSMLADLKYDRSNSRFDNLQE